MYPLNVSLPAGAGFAVANDEAEHASLTAAGYLPALVDPPAPEGDPLKAEAEALGIVVDARWGDKRLAAEIAKAKA
ncbi:MAG: hypothetical protein HYX42_04040 [Polaromonas sp.]|uniref:hypothetical protein n=1 Tax=Polaromonas sp. TaxID=1869339 RepID=UPI0025CF3098|nr:hypothetical protein [Polaromonas sp.]MBI2725401.1 hypothetical protein [Polaromonas sp.]